MVLNQTDRYPIPKTENRANANDLIHLTTVIPAGDHQDYDNIIDCKIGVRAGASLTCENAQNSDFYIEEGADLFITNEEKVREHIVNNINEVKDLQ